MHYNELERANEDYQSLLAISKHLNSSAFVGHEDVSLELFARHLRRYILEEILFPLRCEIARLDKERQLNDYFSK